MRNLSCTAARLWRSEDGSVFPLTAVGILVLAGLIGGGVDMARAYQAQNRLQNACDAGVLAGRKTVTTNGFDDAAQQAATNFFNVNFSGVPDVTAPSFMPTSTDNGQTITGSASIAVRTVVMNIFGFNSIPISVSCSASLSMGNADVVMVLDTTGSMDWDISGSDTTRRIDALENAMKNFYDSLATVTATSNARVRYGFVPYSQTVNVGGLLASDWLVGSMDIQSREAQYIDEERDTDEIESYGPPSIKRDDSIGNPDNSEWTDYRGSWGKNSKCKNNLPENTAWQNGSTTTSTNQFVDSNGNRVTELVTTIPQERTEYQCYRKSRNNHWIESRTATRDYLFTITSTEEPIFKKEIVKVFDQYIYKNVNYDVSDYKGGSAVTTVTGDGGSEQSSTWAGCIEERNTVASGNIDYSSIFGFTPSGLNDLDIDSVPSSDATRWRPMWPEVAYVRTNSAKNRLTSTSQSDYGIHVGSSCPIRAQLLTEMTEDEFDDYAEALTPTGSTYHSIGMIWGARLSSPQGLFQANVNEAADNGAETSRHIIFMTDGETSTSYRQSAWGVEWHDRRVTDDGWNNNNDRHDQRLLAVCSAAKAKGIRIWVIAFTTSLTGDLNDCASSESSFVATDADELNKAFQEIAKNVGELRITQ